jgi:ElaB/YqjD/DUF883 family membrane-anchored ribosome-binding protein
MYTTAKDTLSDAQRKGETLKKDARDTVNVVGDDLQDMARHAGQRVREVVDTYSHNVTDAAGNVTTKIRDNPLQASMIALGVGFIAGMLLRRS